MSSELPESIMLSKRILARVHRGSVAGHSYVDADDQWIVQLGLSDPSGQRALDVMEGDSFEFAGARWKVGKVYEPSAAPYGPLAELTRMSEPKSARRIQAL